MMTEGLGVGDLSRWFEIHAKEVRDNHRRYFEGTKDEKPFTGRYFETFTAQGNPFRFQPSDVLAVEALSVEVPTESAVRLLVAEADRFNSDLSLPLDVDLWEMSRSEIADPNSVAWKLHAELKCLDDVAGVVAGKLMAAKRPRLIPIFDSFIREELKPARDKFWVGMYDQLAGARRRNGR
jgi:Family of unknown function (DUF6308)